MKNEFSTIDTNDLDSVTGGRGAAVRNAAQWAWKNVAAPVAGGAAWEAASRWIGGGSQPAQPPASGQ